jgi:DNA-binding XRE family transcriptional regulator
MATVRVDIDTSTAAAWAVTLVDAEEVIGEIPPAVAEVRKALGMARSVVAEFTGIQEHRLAKFEQGKAGPSVAEAVSLARWIQNVGGDQARVGDARAEAILTDGF